MEFFNSLLELARFKYSRHTIFKKVCARSIAELRRQANNAERRGDFEQALVLQREILGFQRGSPEPGLEIARLLVNLEQWEEAKAVVDELLARSGTHSLKPRTRAKVEELRADILWRSNQPSAAADGYQRCLGLGLNDSDRRALTLKLVGTTSEDPVEQSFIFQYLFEANTRSQYLWTAQQWAGHAPNDPLVRYLIGFQLSAARMPDQAIHHLTGPPGYLSHTELDEQRQILLARAFADIERFDAALEVWGRLVDATSSRTRLLAVEGIDRVHFARGQALQVQPPAP